jgi:hypothetical protein
VTRRTDWLEWHRDYEDAASDLARRRRAVQREVNRWLDSRTDDDLRVVSACSGDGRDVLEVLAARPDASRVRARLLELDPALAGSARRYAEEHGLAVQVLELDAGRTDSYRDAVPADLLMLCGVFGNLTDEDARATVGVARQLCASGAEVIWTRGRFEDRDAVEPTLRMREWFDEERFELVAVEAPEEWRHRVVVHRYTGDPVPLEPGRTFFTFTR